MPKYALATNWRIFCCKCGLAGASMRDRVIDWGLRGPGKGCVETSSLLGARLAANAPFLGLTKAEWLDDWISCPPRKRRRTTVVRHDCQSHHFPRIVCALGSAFRRSKYLVRIVNPAGLLLAARPVGRLGGNNARLNEWWNRRGKERVNWIALCSSGPATQ